MFTNENVKKKWITQQKIMYYYFKFRFIEPVARMHYSQVNSDVIHNQCSDDFCTLCTCFSEEVVNILIFFLKEQMMASTDSVRRKNR